MNVDILEDLGLTRAEIKTYISLLELGSSTAGPIVDKAELQHSVVYRALHSLSEKGLINHIQEGKRKIYQSSDPEHLINFIDDKKQQVRSLLPELKKHQALTRRETATVFKGVRGVTEVYTTMVNSAGEYNSFGGGVDCAKRMGIVWWQNIHAKRVANKLPSRQVFDESVRKDAGPLETLPLSSFRYLPHEFASFQETVIVGDKVAINVFTPNPYSFLIEDKFVAEGYRKHFELLWGMAKE